MEIEIRASRRARSACASGRAAGHPDHQIPGVTVEVFEGVAVHETVVLWVPRSGSTSRDHLDVWIIKFLATTAGGGHDDFGALCCVAKGLFGKSLEEFFDPEHDVDVRLDNHTGCSFARERRFEFESQGTKERLRPLKCWTGRLT